jgi:iron complex transport system substrate-binding protein
VVVAIADHKAVSLHDAPAAQLSRRVFLSAVIALSACSSKQRREGVVQRIVSISPNTTESLFAIGAGSLLVGRSRYCDYPPEVKSIPSVGGFVDVSLEAVLALRPDLVVGARGPAGPSLVERLGARGVATYFPPTESIDEIDQMILGLAAKVSRVAEADTLVAKMREARERVRAMVVERPKARTLLLVGASPIVAAGPASFLDEMLSMTGGKNVLEKGSTSTAYPSLALEQVLVLDPDLILVVMGDDASALNSSEVWQRVRAVREGRVVHLAPDVLQRPGPRIAEGLRDLARAIHPESFSGAGAVGGPR